MVGSGGKNKFGVRNSGIKPDKGHIGHQAAKMMKRSKSLQARQEQAMEEKSRLLKNIESADKLSIRPLKYYANRLVEAIGLSISYGEKKVCNNLRFTIEQGEQIALCGKNGCGKSSVLKLLTGEDIAYEGFLKVSSGLIVSYIPQDTSFLKGDLKEYAQKHNLDESLFKTILRKLDFSRLQFGKDMEDFSEGQKKKVLLAGSLCENAHLYIWDEPLNFVDVLSRMQIADLIREYKPTMIFVEHDRSFVDDVATKIIKL